MLCVDIIPEKDRALDVVEAARGNLHHAVINVTEPTSVQQAVGLGMERFASMDVLVNNVAIQHGVSDDGTKRGASEVCLIHIAFALYLHRVCLK